MDDTYTEKRSLLEHIRAIPDPRMENKCRHSLVDIMAITLCAVLCGADDWNAIESFGKSKRHWFEQFLELPNGIPSHDTFRRLFAILSPTTFQAFFTRWVPPVSGRYRRWLKASLPLMGRRSEGLMTDSLGVRRFIGLAPGRLRMLWCWGKSKPKRNPMRLQSYPSY